MKNYKYDPNNFCPPSKISIQLPSANERKRFGKRLAKFQNDFVSHKEFHKYRMCVTWLMQVLKYGVKAWSKKATSDNGEPLDLHCIFYNGERYHVCTLENAFDKKHKNHNRIDRICLAEVNEE